MEEGEEGRWRRERKGSGGEGRREVEERGEGNREEFVGMADGHALCCLAVCDTPSSVR